MTISSKSLHIFWKKKVKNCQIIWLKFPLKMNINIFKKLNSKSILQRICIIFNWIKTFTQNFPLFPEGKSILIHISYFFSFFCHIFTDIFIYLSGCLAFSKFKIETTVENPVSRLQLCIVHERKIRLNSSIKSLSPRGSNAPSST